MSDEWDEESTAAHDLAEVAAKLGRAAKATPCVTVLTGGSSGRQFKIEKGQAVIGRIPTAQIRLEDTGISRTHARIRAETGRAWVEDLASRNGTFINGQRITAPVELHEGDKIQIGRTTVLRYGVQDALDESFHESLLSSALRDGLTRLFNKRYLMERLDSELKFAARHKAALALLMLDVDHFKNVNDTHGHLAGDQVLTALAAVLAKAVRNEDVVARFGGEEFAIVLRAIEVDSALLMAERLRKLIEALVIPFGGADLKATVSIGVAGFPSTPAHTPSELVEAADMALYRAKHAGRNRSSR